MTCFIAKNDFFHKYIDRRNGDVVTIRCGQELNDDGSVRYDVNIEQNQACEESHVEMNAWYKMIKQGATTTFEAWGKEDKWNNSLFHLTLSYAATYIADIDHKNILK